MAYDMDFDKSNLAIWYVGISDATGGWLTYGLLIILFTAAMVHYVKLEQNPVKGMIIGSLLTAVIAMLFTFMGAITWEVSVIPLVLLLISIIVKQFMA